MNIVKSSMTAKHVTRGFSYVELVLALAILGGFRPKVCQLRDFSSELSRIAVRLLRRPDHAFVGLVKLQKTHVSIHHILASGPQSSLIL